ncbi:AraC family transcriptional regulator [Streptomyces fuscichromogenes]|uniref:AraC family transcriptional regulator n=1 Tax=Streptomyces fuscichromogenes TaxID=1324013 RepID=A0A917XL75_9ACTN|nr:AraC family transcriptional regulator [Streptomyces fuscichromogenes]
MNEPGAAQPETADTGRRLTEIVRTTSLGTWTDAIRDTFVALDIKPAESAPFTGTVRTRRLAHLLAADVLATSQTFDRTGRLASRQPLDLMQIGMVVAGEGELVQDGRTCALRPGDFAIYESARPFTWHLRPEWHLRVFTWPRESIPLSETRSQQLTARTVRADSAVGQLISPLLSGILTHERDVSSGGAIRLADEIAELAITAALEEGDPGDPDSRAQEFRETILRYIDAHIDDADLTPQQIAQAFFISPRTLHRLFARFGETVATTIRLRRLQACRQAMLSPQNAHQPLTDIASRFGFADLAVFSRAFKAMYGVSPSRYRELNR